MAGDKLSSAVCSKGVERMGEGGEREREWREREKKKKERLTEGD